LFHTGEANGIAGEKLAAKVSGQPATKATLRQLRHAIEELRRKGVGICGVPEAGYFMASDAAELNRGCEFLFARAITGLEQIAAMKGKKLPNLRELLEIGEETAR
jgi:hypothetical protein